MKVSLITKIIWLVVLVVVTALVSQPLALAEGLSDEDQQSIYNDTVWYQSLNGSCTTQIDPGLDGNDNRQIAFNFFVRNGFTVDQAAGIVGNMMWESGIVPQKIEGGGLSKNPADAGTKGWGIVQWTGQTRPTSTKVYGIMRDAHISGPIYELSTQLQMVLAQLQGKAGGYSEKQAGDEISKTKDLESATIAFQGTLNNKGGVAIYQGKQYGPYYGFERPADEQRTVASRIRFAKQVRAAFGGSINDLSDSVSGLDSCPVSSSPGQDTRYIDGFPIYNQCDPQWKNKPYGSGSHLPDACNHTVGPNTIGADGCGPSAMAMIITALTGKQITPDITAAYATSQNLYVRGEGSSWEIGRVLAEHWGLKATLIGADKAKITATLQNGGLVIAAGKGPAPFTTGGHFLVIRAVTADGRWMVGDSGHTDTNDKKWSANQILEGINSNGSSGSVYAITK